MPDIHKAVDTAIDEAVKAVGLLGKKSTVQIATVDERSSLKAVCLAWLTSHRPNVTPHCDADDIAPINDLYTSLLAASEGHPSRKHTKGQLKLAKKLLVALRSKLVLIGDGTPQDDKPPQFSKLAPDPDMQAILLRRWEETTTCMNSGAYLAAVVMMGGLLESLLLARINVESDKGPIFKAKSAPIDKATGKTAQLKEWTLKDYIDVEHELKWITKSTKDIGEVLRDWRNYIHPHKQHSHKVQIVQDDALLFWAVAKSIARQVIASVP